MAEPKIYTRNYIDENSVFTSSHGDTFINRIYDWDRDSQWISVGANSDSTEVTLTVEFYEAGAAIERTIDRIILINHNLKDPTFEYWNGSAWVSLVVGSALAVANTIFTFNSVSTLKIRVRCSTTQVAAAEKAIGEFIACALTVALDKDFTAYQPTSRPEAYELKLADGSIHRTVVKHSLNQSEKYEAHLTFQFVSVTEFATLRALKQSGVAFIWHPESITQIDEIYYGHWTGPFQWKYVSTYKTAGAQVEFNFKQA